MYHFFKLCLPLLVTGFSNHNLIHKVLYMLMDESTVAIMS